MHNTHDSSFELLETITSTSLQEISRLLDAGANPNSRDPLNGSTCLHKLASIGRLDAIQLLLSRGADPNILTQNTSTSPLAVAALAGKETTVDLLIKNGALLSQPELTSSKNAKTSATTKSQTPSNHLMPIRILFLHREQPVQNH